MKKSSITINWKGKEGKRGLSELAIEKLLSVGNKHKKDDLVKKAEQLEADYNSLKIKEKIFDVQKEIDIVGKYINIRV
jgi:hypothetical protein